MFNGRNWLQVGAGPYNFAAGTGATGGVTMAIGAVEGAATVEQVHVLNSAAIATHATNYVTFNLLNLGTAGTGTTVIATASTSQTGGSAVVANKPFALTITEANAALTDGQVIGLKVIGATSDSSAVAMGRVNVYLTQTGASA